MREDGSLETTLVERESLPDVCKDVPVLQDRTIRPEDIGPAADPHKKEA